MEILISPIFVKPSWLGSAMAIYALEYLKKNPDAVVVLLSGTGHAQKGAVPRQISLRSADTACSDSTKN